jgi:catechol 2,3-dioxygenase-like lactoylglutathione lyase family enzyme
VAPIPVSTLNHVTLTVSDVQRSVEFYQRVLGMPFVTLVAPVQASSAAC